VIGLFFEFRQVVGSREGCVILARLGPQVGDVQGHIKLGRLFPVTSDLDGAAQFAAR
jgi:hypothetical protein